MLVFVKAEDEVKIDSAAKVLGEKERAVFEKTGKSPRTPFKHTPLTQPIAKFLAKPQAGKYPLQGDLQLRIDLETMLLVATSNVPFSWIDSEQFRR